MGVSSQAEQAADLGLRPGMVVEVMTPENRLLFVGRVEAVQNGAVSIREAKDDELPMVLCNKELKLRFYREQDSVVLHGKVCGSTMRMWKVDRLKSAFTKEQRAFFRQSISLDITARCARRSHRNGQPRASFPCQVLDVSAGGLLISSQEVYLVGDRLVVSDATLIAGERPFTFDCHVRRAGEWKKGVVRYGCQFETLAPKEQDRLLRAIFTLQREEIRKRKIN